MRTKISFILINLSVLAVVAISCKKNSAVPAYLLSPSGVYIRETSPTDTLSQSVSVETDSVVTINLQAALKSNGLVTSGSHAVIFAIDTAQIAAYRSKYGPATLLPLSNYFLAVNSSILSDTGTTSAELNIVHASSLPPSATYVLPVVIQSIDQQALESPDNGQVIYLIVKTLPIDYGVPISKAGWSIIRFSSQYDDPSVAASFVLDGDLTTAWYSDFINQNYMPQYVTIDMKQQYDLKAVTFNYWPAASTTGANPTQILIELSKDNITWINAGTYSGGTAISGALRQLKIRPVTPARYIRFTVLQATLFGGYYTGVALAEIGANN